MNGAQLPSSTGFGLFARRGVQLVERLHGDGDLVLGHADAVVTHPPSDSPLSINCNDTITWPPTLANLMALERRLSRICLNRLAIGDTAGRFSASEVRSTTRAALASG